MSMTACAEPCCELELQAEETSQRPWFVFAGGGTGGHLFPALGVVEALRAFEQPLDVSFFCTQRPIDRDILERAGVEAVPLSVRPLTSKPWHWPQFWWHWRKSVRLCIRRFRKRRPAAVIGAGGYASGPPVRAAITLGIPTFMLNPDAVPGRANQHLARGGRLRAIFAQWEVTRKHFSRGSPVVVSGCPVRKAFRAAANCDRFEVMPGLGLDPRRATLLVTGASQGARTINEAITTLLPMLKNANWQVLHLSGATDYAQVSRVYQEMEMPGAVLPFTDRMAEAMSICDLLISRAGASTLAEIQAVGKASILLPYPFHKDRHQWHNAKVLADAGAAVIVDDCKDAAANARLLEPILKELLSDVSKRDGMACAARNLDRPDAASVIADCLWRAPRA